MDVFAWTVVGSVAGVVGASAAIVFGLVPFLLRRHSRPSGTKEIGQVGSSPTDYGVTVVAPGSASPGLTQPGGAVKVKEARPGELGVHAAIRVDGAVGEMPTYVARRADVRLREALAAGAVDGCFVLLVGGSSVGKTRLLFEAVRGQLDDWWLVQPASGEEVDALAASPSPRVVVWLDEMERYLSGERAISPASVRRLLRAREPVVIAGTLWPDSYRLYAVQQGRDKDRYAAGRELLSLARVIDVADSLDAEEQALACSLISRCRSPDPGRPRFGRLRVHAGPCRCA